MPSHPSLSGLIVEQPHPSNCISLADLAAPFVRMRDDEALDVARRHFGLAGGIARLATEKDDTFRLDSSDGRRHILKVANPAEPQAEIDLQVAVLEHIAIADPALPVPRIIPNLAGASHFLLTDRAGQARSVRLMSYLPGTPLDTLDSTAPQREAVGAILARLRLCMSDFEHAAAGRTLAWDVKNLSGLAHLARGVGDPRQRAQLEAGLERYYQYAPRIARLPAQVLHNDFSKSNIVVDAAAAHFVTGIIDFGDTVRTAIAIDVATALLNQLPRNTGTLPDDDLFADARDLLRGYLRVAPLSTEELAMIPHLVMARIITRALLSLHLASGFPDNATYLLRNTLQGWAQLDWFLQRSPDDISSALTTPIQPAI